MIFWYTNSFFASVLSVLGGASITFAVIEFFKDPIERELSTTECIIALVVGIVLMILGKVVSVNKEKKKCAKAAKQDPSHTYNAAQSGAYNAQAAYNAQTSYNAPSVMPQKRVKKSVVTAGIFFLIAMALGIWSFDMYNDLPYYYTLDIGPLIEYAMCFVLMIASFRTRCTQEVSAFHLIGFLGLLASSINTALYHRRMYVGVEYMADIAVHYATMAVPLCKIAAFALMTLFALFAMKRAKKHTGGIVRALWILPALCLIAANGRLIQYKMAFSSFGSMVSTANFALCPELIDILSQLVMMLAVLMTGISFMLAARKPEVQYAAQPQYAAPAQESVRPQHTVPAQEPVRPQYAAQSAEPKPAAQPDYTAPAQSVSAKPAPDPETEKKLQAYKDLLECGILTPEEYEQKVRELSGR